MQNNAPIGEPKDYCQYILGKCQYMSIYRATNKESINTKAKLLEAYDTSVCNKKITDRKYRFERLKGIVGGYFEKFLMNESRLNSEAKSVLMRCRKQIKTVMCYEDMATCISDYLWVASSIELFLKNDAQGEIPLIDNIIEEISCGSKWLENICSTIEKAEYDLLCMKEAQKLSFAQKIFLGTVHPDVARYVGEGGYLPSELKIEISICEDFIYEYQMLYYALVVTNVYKEELRRRFR